MTRLRDQDFRLRRDSYPRRFPVRVTYGDVDSFHIVNNVAIARFLEEGRASLNMEAFGIDAVVRPEAGRQLLFASITIDYLSQGEYPGDVEVASGVTRIGGSSFTIAG